eukprot:GHVP01055033.1.p1 GENE.GHVP01055033.1~~GHVP01055033.1.p1  ORF type:complete len:103 (-),score=14.88 GHVP01055033.1:78-386(-)
MQFKALESFALKIPEILQEKFHRKFSRSVLVPPTRILHVMCEHEFLPLLHSPESMDCHWYKVDSRFSVRKKQTSNSEKGQSSSKLGEKRKRNPETGPPSKRN